MPQVYGMASCLPLRRNVCSDGKLKPRDEVAKAAGNGVTFVALTGHDTMVGMPEAMAAARRIDLLVVPGVAISAEVTGGESLHILGYFFHGSNSDALETQLEKVRVGRHRRGKEILRKLVSPCHTNALRNRMRRKRASRGCYGTDANANANTKFVTTLGVSYCAEKRSVLYLKECFKSVVLPDADSLIRHVDSIRELSCIQASTTPRPQKL